MSGLPNLQKLIKQATPDGLIASHEDVTLALAAPALAELLIECADFLHAIERRGVHQSCFVCGMTSPYHQAGCRMGILLARLADYDGRIK